MKTNIENFLVDYNQKLLIFQPVGKILEST